MVTMKLITFIGENHTHIQSLNVSLKNCNLTDTDCLINSLKKCHKLSDFETNLAGILLMTLEPGKLFGWDDISSDTNILTVIPPQLLTWLESFGGFKTMYLWATKRTVLNDKISRKIWENNPQMSAIFLYGCQSDLSCSFDALNSLFVKCAKLEKIQLSNFEFFTSEQYKQLFSHTPSLEMFDIYNCTNFDEVCVRDVAQLNPQLKSVSLRTNSDKTRTKNMLLELFQVMGRTDIVVREY
jgi:hypothetical protein